MPIVRTPVAGDVANAAATLSLRRTITLAADAVVNSDPLAVSGVPRMNYWINQTAGAAGASCRLQFMPRQTTGGGGVPIPEWLLLQAPIILTPGGNAPTRVELGFAVFAIRVTLTRSPGVNTTIELYLSAAGSS